MFVESESGKDLPLSVFQRANGIEPNAEPVLSSCAHAEKQNSDYDQHPFHLFPQNYISPADSSSDHKKDS